ncbi:hypothetical protein [Geobacillus stearothermophilus]|uniref:hypothetical protein n=1 Tax=Geobacillus TaxID=129337 RepID=UPI00069F3A42
MKQAKTNAMRLLDREGILYDVWTYENNDGKIDGVSVAKKIGKDPKTVYKTLVTKGSSGRRVDYPIKSKGYRKKSTFPVECE